MAVADTGATLRCDVMLAMCYYMAAWNEEDVIGRRNAWLVAERHCLV